MSYTFSMPYYGNVFFTLLKERITLTVEFNLSDLLKKMNLVILNSFLITRLSIHMAHKLILINNESVDPYKATVNFKCVDYSYFLFITLQETLRHTG